MVCTCAWHMLTSGTWLQAGTPDGVYPDGGAPGPPAPFPWAIAGGSWHGTLKKGLVNIGSWLRCAVWLGGLSLRRTAVQSWVCKRTLHVHFPGLPLAGDTIVRGAFQHVPHPHAKPLARLDLGNSTQALFQEATLGNTTGPLQPRLVPAAPPALFLSHLHLTGLGPAPLSSEPGAAASALPLWALRMRGGADGCGAAPINCSSRAASLVNLHTVSLDVPILDFTALLMASQLGLCEALQRAQAVGLKHGPEAAIGRHIAQILAGLEALQISHSAAVALMAVTPAVTQRVQGVTAANASALFINKLNGWGVAAVNIVVRPAQPLQLCSLPSLLTWSQETTCDGWVRKRTISGPELGLAMGLGLGLGAVLLLLTASLLVTW